MAFGVVIQNVILIWLNGWLRTAMGYLTIGIFEALNCGWLIMEGLRNEVDQPTD